MNEATSSTAIVTPAPHRPLSVILLEAFGMHGVFEEIREKFESAKHEFDSKLSSVGNECVTLAREAHDKLDKLVSEAVAHPEADQHREAIATAMSALTPVAAFDARDSHAEEPPHAPDAPPPVAATQIEEFKEHMEAVDAPPTAAAAE